jgi:hypothetical protein
MLIRSAAVTPAVGVSVPSCLASLAPVALRGTGVTGSPWASASGLLEAVRTRGVPSGSGCERISPSANLVVTRARVVLGGAAALRSRGLRVASVTRVLRRAGMLTSEILGLCETLGRELRRESETHLFTVE